jgi:hypothetical protein
MSGIQ